MNCKNYDDPGTRAQWVAGQFSKVIDYLQLEKVRHGGIEPEPCWNLAPFVTVWAVTPRQPREPGFWVISGDLPTDYIEATTIPDVRQAMGAFAARWRDLADRMLRGDKHPEFTVGHPEDQLSVSKLLHNRATILQEFVEDEEAWQGGNVALENA